MNKIEIIKKAAKYKFGSLNKMAKANGGRQQTSSLTRRLKSRINLLEKDLNSVDLSFEIVPRSMQYDKVATGVAIDKILKDEMNMYGIEYTFLSLRFKVLNDCKICDSLVEIIEFLITEQRTDLLEFNFIQYKFET